MALIDSNPLWIIGRVFNISGFILYLVGFANSYWVTFQDQEGVYYYTFILGLFKICLVSVKVSECKYNSDMQDWNQAALGLACVGLIFLFVGDCTTFLAKSKSNLILARAGAAMEAAAGVFGIIGATVFLDNTKNSISGISVGWSAIIFFIGCALSIIGAVLQAIHIATSSGRAGYSERTPLLPN